VDISTANARRFQADVGIDWNLNPDTQSANANGPAIVFQVFGHRDISVLDRAYYAPMSMNAVGAGTFVTEGWELLDESPIMSNHAYTGALQTQKDLYEFDVDLTYVEGGIRHSYQAIRLVMTNPNGMNTRGNGIWGNAVLSFVEEVRTVAEIFPDAVLQGVIIDVLQDLFPATAWTADTLVTEDQLLAIRQVEYLPEGSQGKIQSLEGVQYLTNLEILDVRFNAISDVSPIMHLTNWFLAPGLSDQTIFLPPQAFSGTVSAQNPVRNNMGIILAPGTISNDGIYDTGTATVTWTGLDPELAQVSFTFGQEIGLGGEMAYFSGTVIIANRDLAETVDVVFNIAGNVVEVEDVEVIFGAPLPAEVWDEIVAQGVALTKANTQVDLSGEPDMNGVQFAFHTFDGFAIDGDTFSPTTPVTVQMVQDGVIEIDAVWNTIRFGRATGRPGAVDVADATVITNHILRRENAEWNFTAADVDRDGQIRMMDLALVQGFQLGAAVRLGGA